MAANSSNTPTPNHHGQPAPAGAPDAKTAADLIRQKVSRLYGDEPNAQQELTETENLPRRSKHQEFMYRLGTSGKDLASIQTEWHSYYQGLPENEKQQVWQEFYASQSRLTGQPASPQTLAEHKHQAARPKPTRAPAAQSRKLRDARSADDIQEAIRDKVTAGGKLQAKHHLQSLLFGLGIGLIVVIIFLFSFFNEVVIAPFIQPSRTAAATPLIVSGNNIAAKAQPEIIIPKINVEIPVDYSQTTTNEAAIENALENGVVHYPSTALPGQNGNAAFFGHSSNNIFNKGKYKFAFVLLRTLQNGDTFYLTYNSKVYVYKVISKTVVEPSNVGVLGPVAGQQATATLITCDPPGTSLHRLIVVGQQISPDPSGNSEAAAASATPANSTNLPGNGPTLLTRVMRTAVGKGIAIVILVALFIWTIRWVNKPRHQ
jgi:LPXTG-site transpeptidase (sortase) family protein